MFCLVLCTALAREPKLVRVFLKAAQRSSRYLADHQEEWIDFNARLFGLDRNIVARSVTRERPTLHFDGQLDYPGLERAIALQHHLGAIKQSLPVSHFVAEGFQPPPMEKPLQRAMLN